MSVLPGISTAGNARAAAAFVPGGDPAHAPEDSRRREGVTMGELRDFQGTWQAAFVVEDGRRRDAEAVHGTQLTISGNRYTLHLGGYDFHGTITGIDPTHNHGPIDFVADGRDGGRRWLGVYVLEDRELTVCVAPPGRERPASFTPRRGGGHWLYLLKRCAPAERPPAQAGAALALPA